MPILSRIRGGISSEVLSIARDLEDRGIVKADRPKLLDRIVSRNEGVASETQGQIREARSMIGAVVDALRSPTLGRQQPAKPPSGGWSVPPPPPSPGKVPSELGAAAVQSQLKVKSL